MRVAVAIELIGEERIILTKWSRVRSTPARLVQRAKMVLLAAEGLKNKQIAAKLGFRRSTVGTWLNRFVEQSQSGIDTTRRLGRMTDHNSRITNGF